MVLEPKSPVPLVSPLGVRMSSLYFSWKRLTARKVAGPYFVVSLPGDPAPVVVT